MAIDGSLRADALNRASALAEQYGTLLGVRAVALGGSLAAGGDDYASDLDLYVYADAAVPQPPRAAIAAADPHAEIDNRWFGPEDAWADPQTGLVVDVVWRTVTWVEDELDRVLLRYEARTGYSTCFWANVLGSRPLIDHSGWYARLQERARQPYPDPLRRAIIAYNLPLLRRAYSAYDRQLAKAVAREDRVSVNHRIAALLASYFDILFALNRVPQPGEKRLVALAMERCPIAPASMSQHIDALLRAAAQSLPAVLELSVALCADLEQLVDENL